MRHRAKKHELPDHKTWKLYDVRIFSYTGNIMLKLHLVLREYSKTNVLQWIDKFETAVAQCNKALETSNVESDEVEIESKKRRRLPPARFSPQTSDNEGYFCIKVAILSCTLKYGFLN